MIKKAPPDTPLTTIWNYSTTKKRNRKDITKKTKGSKGKVFGKMEKLRYIRSNMGTKNSFEKRPNIFKTIPKSDIKGKMLPFKFNNKVCRERLPKFKFSNLGKRWERSNCYDLSLTGRFAGYVCQNLGLAVWANVGNVQIHWERQERWQRSRRVKRF